MLISVSLSVTDRGVPLSAEVSSTAVVPLPLALLPAVSVAETVTVIVPSASVLRSAVPFAPLTVVLPSLKLTVTVASVSRPVTV